MTFQTLSFVALLLATFALYWLLPRRMQNLLLLSASYVFYGYVDARLVLLIGVFTLVMYGATLGIDAANSAGRTTARRIYLYVAVLSAVGLIVVFKYMGFFLDEAGDLASALGFGTFSNTLDIILPIGISFYTLQTLGYAIDVYRGRIGVRKNLLDFALFVAFFPQLIAGPIERAANLLPQLESRRRIDSEDLQEAVTLILWGFFKKLVIADNVGVIADSTFGAESPGFALAWVGVVAFGIQIFADFSGYTDIARGTARLFGIRLSRNFDHPYLARSPVDFWRRWHITLSTWFRDYVYIPLGGSRRGRVRNAGILLVTFLLSGAWHGAAWNFALWGGYHAMLVLGQRSLLSRGGVRLRVPAAIGVFSTFVLVTIGWMLFRESDMGHVWRLVTSAPWSQTASDFETAAYLLLQVAVYSLPLWAHAFFDKWAWQARPRISLRRLSGMAPRVTTATALFTTILLMRTDAGGEFIYFQF